MPEVQQPAILQGMGSLSYGISWHEQGSGVIEGRLQLTPSGIVFDGRDDTDQAIHRELGYHELTGVRVVEEPDARPADHTLLLQRRAGDIAIRGAATRSGIFQQLTAQLTDLSVGELRRAVVVLPLREGSAAKVRELVAGGPPFDPSDVPLTRHEVFVTAAEAVFVFEAPSAAALESLLGQLDVWAAAASWREVVSGPPRLGEVEYVWREARAATPHVGLGF